MGKYFYPRPPRGGRLTKLSPTRAWTNFYPRPPRGGRQAICSISGMHACISIHALREEGDAFYDDLFDGFLQFLSTPSARRATRRSQLHRQLRRISIHALREEGDFLDESMKTVGYVISIHALREEGDKALLVSACISVDISIHALREEGDRPQSDAGKGIRNFYPRPPRGGRQFVYPGEAAVTIFLSTPSARRAT